MEIGQIIKKRREELGMSQEELARKVGYKSRSSINKIEIDGRGLPQSKIVAIAKALQTTPAKLMGWDDNMSNTENKKDENGSIKPDIKDDLDLRKIERAMTKMPTQDKKKMMKILELSFEDYFSNDYEDDDLDE